MPEIIPLNATVHFKCAFDIKPEGVTKPMTHLRKKALPQELRVHEREMNRP